MTRRSGGVICWQREIDREWEMSEGIRGVRQRGWIMWRRDRKWWSIQRRAVAIGVGEGLQSGVGFGEGEQG